MGSRDGCRRLEDHKTGLLGGKDSIENVYYNKTKCMWRNFDVKIQLLFHPCLVNFELL